MIGGGKKQKQTNTNTNTQGRVRRNWASMTAAVAHRRDWASTTETERERDREREKRERGREREREHTRENERGREGERGREREERESKDTRRGRRTEGPALSTDLRKALSAAARVCPGPSPGRRPARRPARRPTPPGDRGDRPAQAAVSAGAGRAGRWHTWRSSSGLCRRCDWRSRYAPQPGRARPSAAASVPRRPLPRRSSVATRPFLAGSRKEEGSSAQRGPRHRRHAGSREGSSSPRRLGSERALRRSVDKAGPSVLLPLLVSLLSLSSLSLPSLVAVGALADTAVAVAVGGILVFF